MDLSGLTRLAEKTSPSAPVATTARVVRVDTAGVWAAPLGDDMRHPYGPCRVAAGASGPIAAGDVVLMVLTPEQPWVIAQEGGA